METPMRVAESKESVEVPQHRDQEGHVGKGCDLGNEKLGIPTRGGIDGLKLGRGLLSFRSRKLLGTLSKASVSSSGASQVLDLPVSRLGAAGGGASQLQSGSAGNETGSKNVEGAKKEGHRELWDPRRVEREAAEARVKLMDQQARAKKKQLQQNRLIEKERTQLEDRVPDGDGPGEQKDLPKDLLPSKLRLLEGFYEGLEAASSLLRIRRQMCTFRAVRKVVESMSKRRFLMKHLAQMKHLFSELMQLDYVRVQDPDSWGEKWDLRITLVPLPSECALSHTRSPLKGSAGQTGATIKRRKEFRARLRKFAANNPEDSELPQAPLPGRPLGGQRPPSPDRDCVTSHPKSLDFVASKLESGVAEATSRTQEEQTTKAFEDSRPSATFEFPIVSPTSGGHVSPPSPDRISHFPAPFSPYFSVPRKPSHSKASEPAEAGPTSGSHFDSSFRPCFSSKPPHPQIKISATLVFGNESRVVATSSEMEGASDPKVGKLEDRGRPTQSPRLPSSSRQGFSVPHLSQPSLLHLGPSPQSKPSSTYLPPCTPNTDAVNSLAQTPAQDRSDQVLPSPRLCTQTSPALGFLTPSDSERPTTYNAQKVLESRSQLSPQKSQGVMRSLRFDSPAKSVTVSSPVAESAKAVDCGILSKAKDVPAAPNASSNVRAPSTHGHSVPSTPGTPAQIFPNKPRTMLNVTPITPLLPGTPLTPPSWQESSNDGSHAKNLASRCLQFSTPGRATGENELITASQTLDSLATGTPCRTTIAASTKVLDVGTSPVLGASSSSSSPQKIKAVSSPVGPSKEDPTFAAKISRTKDVLCSPPKRTKLCLAPHRAHVGGEELKTHDPAKFVGREDENDAILSSDIDALGMKTLPLGSDAESPLKLTADSPLKVAAVLASKSRSASPVKTPSAFPSKFSSASPSRLSYASPTKLTSAFPSATGGVGDVIESTRRLSKSDSDIVQNLPPDLVQSVQEKERKLQDESRRELAKERRRQQMLGGVPKLFNQLRVIFQSLNRSVLPRKELVRSILSSHPDITDKGEVEERLQLVTELAPDYLKTLHSQSGELLYRIDKRANVLQIQRRLADAC